MNRRSLVSVLAVGPLFALLAACSTTTDAPSEGAASQDFVQDLSLAFSCKTAPNVAEDPRDPSRRIEYPSREFYFRALKVRDKQNITFADFETDEEDDDGRFVKVKGYDTLGEYECQKDTSRLACHIETLNENADIGRSARRIILEGDGDGCEWTTLKLSVPKASGDTVKGKLYWEGTTNCFGSDLFPKEHSWEVECSTAPLQR